MKKITRRSFLSACGLAALSGLALAGCGAPAGAGSASGQGGTPAAAGERQPIEDYVTYELATNEMDRFFILNSNTSANNQVLSNLYDGLLEVDNRGNLVPALAESWGTEDGGWNWTFHLRQNANWVDSSGEIQQPITAQDFVTGLEWVLNYHKNEAANTSMPIELIAGAKEYYEYTKGLEKEAALKLDSTVFLQTVGVEAEDDYTLHYTCAKAAPYFASVSAYVCLYPLAQALVDRIGAENLLAADRTELWYSGAYLLTEFVHGSEKYFEPNPNYWDTGCTRFHSVTVRMLDSQETAYLLYQNGQLDHVTLSESHLSTIAGNPNHPYYNELVETRPTKFAYSIHFNFDKREEDRSPDGNWNLAAANTAFRRAWYYGIDLLDYLRRFNALDPLACENNAYSMKGFVYTSDGTDYVELVKARLGIGASDGETLIRVDHEKAEQYKQQAITELTAKGVSFPVEAAFYVPSGDTTAMDNALVLKQVLEDGLGRDFVTLDIRTYVSSVLNEVVTPRLQSFTLGGWGADYGDPQNYLGQEVAGSDDAYYANKYSNVNDAADPELTEAVQTFTALVAQADAVTEDLDERYAAYAEAEAYLIDQALVIPAYYSVQWQLTHVNDYTKMYAMFGCQNFKYKNWETSTTAYTTEEYEAFAAAL